MRNIIVSISGLVWDRGYHRHCGAPMSPPHARRSTKDSCATPQCRWVNQTQAQSDDDVHLSIEQIRLERWTFTNDGRGVGVRKAEALLHVGNTPPSLADRGISVR